MTVEPMSTINSKSVTYEELKRHSSYSDAWISINGTVYDITEFIPKHPFGDTFRGNLGTECRGLFSSAHINTDVERLMQNGEFLSNHGITVVGHLDVTTDGLGRRSDHRYLDRIVYQDTDKDEFWLALKAAVASYLQESGETTHYTLREGLLYLSYYLSIYLILAYLTWIGGSLIAAGLLGFHMVCASSHIAHMAAHHGFTRNRLLNGLAMHFFDLCGMSCLEWQIAHQTHHNQPHSSIDHQTNSYDHIGIRIHQYMKHRGYHKYQFIYFWIVISSYLAFRIFVTTVWLFKHKEFVRHRHELLAHMVARIIVLSQVTCCAYLHGYMTAIALFAVYSIACSQTAFILLYNNFEDTHSLLGETEDIHSLHYKLSWAEVQVRTSSNWYPTNWILSFIEFHYGYFNYHIEHHLFPTLKPSLLKKISPVVRRICSQYGIPYISTPFMDIQRSLQRHLLKLSLTEYPRRVPKPKD